MTTQSSCGFATASSKLLLTGDAGAEFEARLPSDLAASPIRILKAGHHGSRTSTSDRLVQAMRPQIALISVGRGNLFGHPAPEVIDRLTRAGARIFRTDRDGAVSVETDGAIRAGRDRARPVVDAGGCRGLFDLRSMPPRVRRAWRRAPIGPRRSSSASTPSKRAVNLSLACRERRFGLDAELARQVREREQQIAQFLGRARRALLQRVAQLAHSPRQSCPSRPVPSASRIRQRRRACRSRARATAPAAREARRPATAGRRAGGLLFARLQLFPLRQDRSDDLARGAAAAARATAAVLPA